MTIIKSVLIFLLSLIPGEGFSVVEFDTVWGRESSDDPLAETLIQHEVMTRLKEIDQSGPVTQYGITPPFSRYDHSLGVYALLRRAGVSRQQQIAGLLHDVSHTAFSHVGDHLFSRPNQEKSYQDKVHLSFLNRFRIPEVISPYGLTLGDMDPDCRAYTALEQHHPHLCADRIQYIIHTGVILEDLTRLEAKKMVDDLTFKNKTWMFSNPVWATKMGNLSLKYTQNLWGSPWNYVFYEQFTNMLRRALSLSIITEDEVKYGTDRQILEKVHSSPDIEIQRIHSLLLQSKNSFEVVDGRLSKNVCLPKFRGVDPIVEKNDIALPLSFISPEFYLKFSAVQTWCARGFGIRYLR